VRRPALQLAAGARPRRPRRPRQAVAGPCLLSYQQRAEAVEVLTVSQIDPLPLLVPGDVKCAWKEGVGLSPASPQLEGE